MHLTSAWRPHGEPHRNPFPSEANPDGKIEKTKHRTCRPCRPAVQEPLRSGANRDAKRGKRSTEPAARAVPPCRSPLRSEANRDAKRRKRSTEPAARAVPPCGSSLPNEANPDAKSGNEAPNLPPVPSRPRGAHFSTKPIPAPRKRRSQIPQIFRGSIQSLETAIFIRRPQRCRPLLFRGKCLAPCHTRIAGKAARDAAPAGLVPPRRKGSQIQIHAL
jgi:hypothetical protein